MRHSSQCHVPHACVRSRLANFQQVAVHRLLGFGQPLLLVEVVCTQEREVVVGVYMVEREDEIYERLAAAWTIQVVSMHVSRSNIILSTQSCMHVHAVHAGEGTCLADSESGPTGLMAICCGEPDCTSVSRLFESFLSSPASLPACKSAKMPCGFGRAPRTHRSTPPGCHIPRSLPRPRDPGTC